jgi:D-erythronate 2-dehydrogenase
MKVFITGGGGFLGYRLGRSILERGRLTGADGQSHRVSQVKVFDVAFPADPDARLVKVVGDVSQPGAVAAAMDPDTATVFHLAAVVSGGAEADFDLGMRVNFEGTHHVLEACRKLARPPKLVYTSSVAAFGGELPAILDDRTTPNPQSSYGAQKVIGEYLITDYTRKGFVDGRSLRLPTVVVRPGKPNLAASSFASGIIREPLAETPCVCPVPDTTGVWLLSPPRVIDAFLHAHELPSASWGVNRVVNLPGITVSVREMLDALGAIAGAATARKVSFVPDPRIQAIVETWPVRFRTERALAMGFKPDATIDAVIRAHIVEQGIRL